MRPVSRVLTLAPDVTELAFALGAGAKVPAVPRSASYPPETDALPRFDENDTEAIVTLRPDLVLATTAGTDPRMVERLRELGLEVATTDVTSFERLGEACRLLGVLLGQPERGDALASDLGGRVAAASARARGWPIRAALFVVWWEPLIVAAPGTFHDDLLRRAGLANLAPSGAGRYPRASNELLLDPRLEVVVAADEPPLRDLYRSLSTRAEERRLARGTVQVIWLPADPASRPGPRLVEALEALVEARGGFR